MFVHLPARAIEDGRTSTIANYVSYRIDNTLTGAIDEGMTIFIDNGATPHEAVYVGGAVTLPEWPQGIPAREIDAMKDGWQWLVGECQKLNRLAELTGGHRHAIGVWTLPGVGPVVDVTTVVTDETCTGGTMVIEAAALAHAREEFAVYVQSGDGSAACIVDGKSFTESVDAVATATANAQWRAGQKSA